MSVNTAIPAGESPGAHGSSRATANIDKGVADFVHHAKQHGMDHATIRVLLLSAGWKEKTVAQALAADSLDIPVPEPVGTGTAREVFRYLLTFTVLYTMMANLIVLFFNYLDLLFPDPAWEAWRFSEPAAQSAIRWSLAALIVTGPLFFALSRSVEGEIRRDPAKARNPVRRWLVHLTMFAASVTLMFDLIFLLYYLLEGDLVIRIALKVLALFVIVGSVFCYQILLRRGVDEARP